MNQVIPFAYKDSLIRTVLIDDKPWWVAKDVCRILELNNVTEALRNLDDDEKFALSNTEGKFADNRAREINVVSESGLYNLIFRSRKPEARRFKKWVTSEVLPQIRKSGGYGGQKELEDMKTRLMRLELNEDTYAALLTNALRTVRRFENRSLLTKEDKREILTLYVQKYPVSAIQKITKKSRTRIKNFINEILRDDEEADALFKEWGQDDEDKIAASRGKGEV
jgi:prophage antirepressor-like protein